MTVMTDVSSFLSRHQPNFPLGEVPSYHQEVDQRLMQRWDVHFRSVRFLNTKTVPIDAPISLAICRPVFPAPYLAQLPHPEPS